MGPGGYSVLDRMRGKALRDEGKKKGDPEVALCYTSVRSCRQGLCRAAKEDEVSRYPH